MAITYPITLPSTPAPSRFSVIETTGVSLTQSPWSFSQQVQLNQGQAWAFSVELPPMNDDQARNWSGIMAQLNGRFGTFMFGDPKWKAPRGSWGGALVNGGAQVGQTLLLRGFVAGAIGRAGDYFQLGVGATARLHKATKDFTADGAGLATVEIWPRLRASPADGDPLIVASPQGVFRLTSGSLSRSWEPFRHGYSFDMMEAL